jgi:hypothetical protein
MLHADDHVALQATRDIEIRADETLTLRVGQSVLRLTPERIELTAPELRLSATHARIVMGDGHTTLDAEGRLTMRGEHVTVAARGAQLQLDANATLEGARVQLNSATTQRDREQTQGPELTRIVLASEAGRPLGARVFILRTREGREYLGITGPDGCAAVDVPDGGSVRFLDHAEVETGQ